MLKSRKTGLAIPIYLINVLPCPNFEDIYNITEVLCLNVTVERFKGANIVKQCYSCQGFGHASEICGFTPKCVKCAQAHLTINCPNKENKMTPLCVNCKGPHVASYRGCPRNPINIKRAKASQTNNKNNFTLEPAAVNLLSTYNYVTKKSAKPSDDPKGKYAYRPPKTNNVNNENSGEKTNEIQDKQSTSAINTESETPPLPPSEEVMPSSSYTKDINDIFSTFKEVKEIFKLTKIIKIFKTIADLTKKCKTPFEKLAVILDNIDAFASEFQNFNDE